MRVVLDTCILVAGLRSRNGASFRVLQLLGEGLFQPVLSVPLVMEYESILRRQSREMGLRFSQIDDVLDFMCKAGEHRQIYFLWRPKLRDPNDDMILELAVESEADAIVTFNQKDFHEAQQFGLLVISPGKLLQLVGGTQ